jgi:hypothetical protein
MRAGQVISHPNREARASRLMKLAVMLLLVASAALILLVTVGGWSKLDGLAAVNVAWALAYLVIAFYVARWARGLLPIAAALSALMLTFALIATASLAGLSWSARAGSGYASAQTLFGGGGLSSHTLDALVVAIAAAQALLVVIAMLAFNQRWNIEYEVPK